MGHSYRNEWPGDKVINWTSNWSFPVLVRVQLSSSPVDPGLQPFGTFPRHGDPEALTAWPPLWRGVAWRGVARRGVEWSGPGRTRNLDHQFEDVSVQVGFGTSRSLNHADKKKSLLLLAWVSNPR